MEPLHTRLVFLNGVKTNLLKKDLVIDLVPSLNMTCLKKKEGKYTGVPTAWFRFFLCNLQCDGFMQKDPTNPDTYELPYLNIDPQEFETLEDLPVIEDTMTILDGYIEGLDLKHNKKELKNLMHGLYSEALAVE